MFGSRAEHHLPSIDWSCVFVLCRNDLALVFVAPMIVVGVWFRARTGDSFTDVILFLVLLALTHENEQYKYSLKVDVFLTPGPLTF